MKNIDRIEKPRTKWVHVKIKAETLKKVKAIPKTVPQGEYIDQLVNKGLNA